MPAEPPVHPPLFAERLTVPRRWWPIAIVGLAVAGAEVFGGFPWWVAVATYVGLGVPVLVLLLGMGRTTVVVDAAGLHAGDRTLAAADMAGATVLDAPHTRLRLGPRGDPRAHVVARGFIGTSVEVAPIDEREVPYWLVSTRRPDELVEALREAVRLVRA
jgi:DUF3093 family protein